MRLRDHMELKAWKARQWWQRRGPMAVMALVMALYFALYLFIMLTIAAGCAATGQQAIAGVEPRQTAEPLAEQCPYPRTVHEDYPDIDFLGCAVTERRNYVCLFISAERFVTLLTFDCEEWYIFHMEPEGSNTHDL